MKTQNYILFIFFILITSLKSYGYQEKSDTISTQDIWSDTIHVIGDITIIQDGDVIINPGTYIEFKGDYFIKVIQTGKMTANGNVNDSIRFIPFDFQIGWKGIKFEDMSATADSSIFEFCSFQYSSGALSIKNFNKIRVNKCNFSNNRLGTISKGGGIYCFFSSVIINNCSFRNNYSGMGGALYFKASHANINNSIVTANTVNWSGAGIYCDTSYLYFNNCLIDSNYNSSTGAGAGLYSRKSDVTLTNCKFINNKRNAIYSYNYGGKLKLDNTLVANNEGSQGAGLNCWGIDLTIINSTIVNNKSGMAGGIYCYYCHNIEIYNSILWNNSGIYPDFYYLNYFPQINNCDIRDGNLLNLPDSQYVNNICNDPKFLNPSVNTGVSNDALQSDWSLMSCSPCINSGDSSLLDSVPLVDLNNNPRIYNDTIDIGAFEYQGDQTANLGVKIIYVKQNGIGDGTSWSNAMGNIQNAIDTPLECYDYLEVWVAAGTYYPLFTGQVYIRETSFELKDNVRLYGGFVGNETDLIMRNWKLNPTILSGDVGVSNVNTDNVYHVVVAENTNNSAILDGFEISGGYANSSSNFDSGGGIYCSYASPVFNNLMIRDNGASDMGGGVCLSYSQPKISNSLVHNNSSYRYGGGIYMEHSNPYLINIQVINNITNGFNGGGMMLGSSNPYIINSIIANNYGSTGGGIYCSFSSPMIINSLFASNESDEGAGIYSSKGSYPSIFNSIFWNNMDDNGINHFAKFYNASDTLFTIFSSLIQGGNTYNFPAAHYVNNIEAIPRFVNPSLIAGHDNNALNADWSLLPCSPCINAGNNILFPDTISYDMAKNDRIFNDTIDIGAYEYQGNSSGMQPKNIIYVNSKSNGGGSSWNDAIGNLQEAINLPCGCYDTSEIWVSAGIYLPDTIELAYIRQSSFTIRNNKNLYGGFAGNESSIDQRDWTINKSVLSGNIGSYSDSTDNCNNVVSIINQDSLIIIDGFTIENGYFNSYANNGGAGIYCKKSNAILKNLSLINNFSDYYGGGIYSTGSKINLENSIFNSNRADAGGAIFLHSTGMEVLNCKMINNFGEQGTGGICLKNTKGNITNCLIANNYGDDAGAIYSYQSNYAVVNSTLINNKCTFGGTNGIKTNDTLFILNSILWDIGYGGSTNQISYNDENLLKVENCDIKNGSNLNIPAANYINNIDIDPGFKNPNTFIGNYNYATLSDWSLKSCSPCINTGFFDSAYITSIFDINRNPRVYNNGIIDMGAYEYQDEKECLYIKFVVTDVDGLGVGYSISLDGMTYQTTDSLGQYQFDDNSYGDKFKYIIRLDNNYIFSDSITNLHNDTTIYYYHSSINENTSEIKWLIYPNPAKDKIEIFSNPGKKVIGIFNMEGQQQKSFIFNETNISIDISSFAKGIYFIRIYKDNNTVMKKFIKL